MAWGKRLVEIVAIKAVLGSLAACRALPYDPRCKLHPPPHANYGSCFSEYGGYFDPQDFRCKFVGCGCGASPKEVPFISVDGCERVCLGAAS